MKKRILALALFAVLTLTVSACDDTTPPETTTPADVTEYDTTDESNDLEIDVEYPPEYSGNDWAAYLDWLQTQLDDGSDSPSVKVPILQSPEYQFFEVTVNQYGYSYIYSATEGQFDVNTGITVTVSREEDSFEAVLDQFDLTATDGAAYVYSRNTWYIENDGKWISISFPGTVTLQDASEIDDYFTFETVTASEVTQ